MNCKHEFMASGNCKYCGGYVGYRFFFKEGVMLQNEEDKFNDSKIDPPFEELGHQIGKVVAEKNKAYGDSFSKSGKIIKILYPDGIKLKQYDDALAVIRIVDKLFRIATDKDAFGESPFRDIVGYGILGTYKSEKEKG